MNSIKIGIVIPTYKRAKNLENCIDSINNQKNNFEYSIIVVNDGSDEVVSNLLRSKYIDTIEIKSVTDLWWTKSVNTGIHFLIDNGFDAAIILNDDVTIGDGFVDSMIKFHKQNPESIIIAKIVDQTGKLWALGGFTSWPFIGEQHNINLAENRKITWSPGMGTFIPLAVIKQIGYLDEKSMPQYLSDADFGLRATRKNIKIVPNPLAIVYNNTLSTGGILNKNKLGLEDLKFIFFDLRSPDLIKARSAFIFRNAPFGLRSISLIFRIIILLIYFVRRIK